MFESGTGFVKRGLNILAVQAVNGSSNWRTRSRTGSVFWNQAERRQQRRSNVGTEFTDEQWVVRESASSACAEPCSSRGESARRDGTLAKSRRSGDDRLARLGPRVPSAHSRPPPFITFLRESGGGLGRRGGPDGRRPDFCPLLNARLYGPEKRNVVRAPNCSQLWIPLLVTS
jgi:hypothetical protein